jgi:hypothetical protein
MRSYLNAINNLPHPEERPKGASRRTHSIGAGILSAFEGRTTIVHEKKYSWATHEVVHSSVAAAAERYCS